MRRSLPRLKVCQALIMSTSFAASAVAPMIGNHSKGLSEGESEVRMYGDEISHILMKSLNKNHSFEAPLHVSRGMPLSTSVPLSSRWEVGAPREIAATSRRRSVDHEHRLRGKHGARAARSLGAPTRRFNIGGRVPSHMLQWRHSRLGWNWWMRAGPGRYPELCGRAIRAHPPSPLTARSLLSRTSRR